MPVYEEESGLPQFILALFAVQFVIFGALSYQETDPVYWGVLILVVAIGLLLALIKLSLRISEKEIAYRLFPFSLRFKTIPWEEIAQAEVIKISALGDFTGWGIRYSFKHGWGYITSTNFGIKIQKTDGSKMVLSLKNKDRFLDFAHQQQLLKMTTVS